MLRAFLLYNKFISNTYDTDYSDIGSKESEGGTGGGPLVPANKHTGTIVSRCISNANKPKTIVSFVQNKLSTKLTPVTPSNTSNTALNKMSTENTDAQSQDNASMHASNLNLI